MGSRMILYEPDNPWSVLMFPTLQMGELIFEMLGSLFKVMQKARGRAGICTEQHGAISHFLNRFTRLPPVWLLFLQIFAFLLQNTRIFVQKEKSFPAFRGTLNQMTSKGHFELMILVLLGYNFQTKLKTWLPYMYRMKKIVKDFIQLSKDRTREVVKPVQKELEE